LIKITRKTKITPQAIPDSNSPFNFKALQTSIQNLPQHPIAVRIKELMLKTGMSLDQLELLYHQIQFVFQASDLDAMNFLEHEAQNNKNNEFFNCLAQMRGLTPPNFLRINDFCDFADQSLTVPQIQLLIKQLTKILEKKSQVSMKNDFNLLL